MIRAKITAGNRTANIRIGNQDVYDYLVAIGVDDEEAIEADSWTEMAAIDEEYDSDDFNITIIDTLQSR